MEIKDPKLWQAFDRYCEWLSLPRHMSKTTPEALEGKGFPEGLIELLGIQTKKAFAEKYATSVNMLKDWDNNPDLQKRIKANWKKWTKHLTPGIMGKFYEKLMQEADAPRMKIWMECVEEENKEDSKDVNINIGFDNIMKSIREDEQHEKQTSLQSGDNGDNKTTPIQGEKKADGV